MNIYVETNFVVEMALLQEEAESCERILTICEEGQAKLIIPAYSFAEPHEKLNRAVTERNALGIPMAGVFNQLIRSKPYRAEAATLKERIVSLFTQSEVEERQRFNAVRERLLQIAEIIRLDDDVLVSAATYERQFGLSPQDSLVFASILGHLDQTSPGAACFIEKDAHDFNDPDIRNLFAQAGRKLIFGFSNGLNYLQSQL